MRSRSSQRRALRPGARPRRPRDVEPRLYVKFPHASGGHRVIPLSYLVPDERRDFLERATTPL